MQVKINNLNSHIMKKLLRILSLVALLCVPWVTQAQNVLFTEDFESGSMPTGWTTDGTGTWTVTTGDYSSTTGAGEGTYNAKITHGTTGAATKLITPVIDLSSVTSAELSFMHIQRSWAGDIDELRVYYRTSTTGTWTLLDGQEYTEAVATWTTEEGIPLPNLSSTYQIAFEYTDRYGYGVGVDLVKIVQGASCAKPGAITFGVGSATTTASWTAGGTETSWNVYLTQGGTPVAGYNPLVVNTTPSCTFTGLTAAATY